MVSECQNQSNSYLNVLEESAMFLHASGHFTEKCEDFSVDFFTCISITLLTYFEHAIYLYLSSMALLIAAVKLGTSSQKTI